MQMRIGLGYAVAVLALGLQLDVHAQTAEEIIAKADLKIQAVSPVPHYKPCPKPTSELEIVVCANRDRADRYKLERDHSPFGGQFKGMTLAEIANKTAEDPWGNVLKQGKHGPSEKALEHFEQSNPAQALPGGVDLLGAAINAGRIVKKTIDNSRDNAD